MIDIRELVRRHQLQSVRTRIDENTDSIDLSHGLYTPADGLLLPRPENVTRAEAWTRAKAQLQTLGTRIMETKLGAILGNVTWGGSNDELDDALTNLDLRSLARRLTHAYVVTGITAAYAHTNERNEPKITRVGGYIEPVTHPDDVDEIIGLYQAWQNPHDVGHHARWTARVYDWSDSAENECELLMWTDLGDPTHLGGVPQEVPNHPRPRYRVRTLSQDGFALGEISTALPQLHALWATEARLVLSEELAAFPMLTAFGGVDTAKDERDAPVVGPSEVWTGSDSARLEWMQPGNLDELRQQRILKLERVRDDLALPGGFLGRDSPSGEALREANVRFRQNSDGYASDMANLLTELVEDFAGVAGATPAPVVVLPSQAYDETQTTLSVLQAYQAGLIPLDVAAGKLRVFYDLWDDDRFTAWVSSQMERVSVSDFDAIAGAADAAR